jgi:hypothetical protein
MPNSSKESLPPAADFNLLEDSEYQRLMGVYQKELAPQLDDYTNEETQDLILKWTHSLANYWPALTEEERQRDLRVAREELAIRTDQMREWLRRLATPKAAAPTSNP